MSEESPTSSPERRRRRQPASPQPGPSRRRSPSPAPPTLPRRSQRHPTHVQAIENRAKQHRQEYDASLPPVEGNRVDRVQDLRVGTDDYFVLRGRRTGAGFIVRSREMINAPTFYGESRELECTFIAPPSYEGVSILDYLDMESNILEQMYDAFAASIRGQNGERLSSDALAEYEMQLHVGISEVNIEEVNSIMLPVTRDNREATIALLRERFNDFLQSSTRVTSCFQLTIRATILQRRPFQGQGLAMLSDEAFMSKALSTQHPTGRLIYNRAKQDCFFSSFFLGVVTSEFQLIQKRLAGVRDAEPRFSGRWTSADKSLQKVTKKLYELLDASGPMIELWSKHFFIAHNINIAALEPGTQDTLKVLYDRFNRQIHVFDQASQLGRILLYPLKFDPRLPQIYLLLTSYARPTEVGNTTRLYKHYHAMTHPSTIMASQDQRVCLMCGKTFTRGNFHHTCHQSDQLFVPCCLCLRLKIGDNDLEENPTFNVNDYCLPDFSTPSKDRTCSDCGKLMDSVRCLVYHQRRKSKICKKKVRCSECNYVIIQRGQDKPTITYNKEGQIIDTQYKAKHEDCSKVFCYGCLATVDRFKDGHRQSTHTCMVQPPKTTCGIPAGLAFYDFETYKDAEGNFQVNACSLVASKRERLEEYRGTIYTEIPEGSTGLILNRPFELTKEDMPEMNFLSSVLPHLYVHVPKNPKKPPAEIPADLDALGYLRPSLVQEEAEEGAEGPATIGVFLEEEEEEDDGECSDIAEAELEEAELEEEDVQPPIEQINVQNKFGQADDSALTFIDYIKMEQRGGKYPHIVIPHDGGPPYETHVIGDTTDFGQLYGIKEELEEPGLKRDVGGEEEEEEEAEKEEDWANCHVDGGSGDGQVQEVHLPPHAESTPEFWLNLRNEHPRLAAELRGVSDDLHRLKNSAWTQNYNRTPEMGAYDDGEKVNTTLARFVRDIMTPTYSGYVFCAHNAKGFDNILLLRHLLKVGIKANVIFVGSKVLRIKIPTNNLTFLDTMSFMASSLRDLPKSFGIQNSTTVRKTFYPHAFNQPKYYNLEMPHLPPKEAYEPHLMTPPTLKDFEVFYAEEQNKPFHNAKTLLTYCLQDSLVLAQCTLKYIAANLEIEGALLHDLQEENLLPKAKKNSITTVMGVSVCLLNSLILSHAFVTCSSYVNYLSRLTVASRHSLPVLQHQYGDSPQHKSSKKEIAYLHYLKSTKYPHLQFSMNQGSQKRVECSNGHTYYLDGYDPISKTAVEFQGCVFHGCPKCTNPIGTSPYNLLNIQTYEHTQLRKLALLTSPEVLYVEEIWECQFDTLVVKTPLLKALVDDKELYGIKHATFREGAYKGGLVICLAVYADADGVRHAIQDHTKVLLGQNSVNILQIDVTSMYPAMLLNPDRGYSSPRGPLNIPIGAPTSIYYPETEMGCTQACCPRPYVHGPCSPKSCGYVCGNHLNFDQYAFVPGYAYVKVIPPKNILYPCLMFKVKKSATEEFSTLTLCRTCAINDSPFSKHLCECTDEERSWEGSYMLEELYVAQKQGFKLAKIHNVVYWRDFKPGIFDTLLGGLAKMKTVASGFPLHIRTDEQKTGYVQELSERTGFDISVEDVKHNPALRGAAKIALNSEIGKQAQRPMSAKALIFSRQELDVLRADPSKIVTKMTFISPTAMTVTYTSASGHCRPYKNGSAIVTSLVNARSRLFLLETCDLLLKNGYVPLYTDTDSITLIQGVSNPPPLSTLIDLSPKFGSWSVDINDGQKMFVLQKKTYQIITREGKNILKAKGFNLLQHLMTKSGTLGVCEQELKIILANEQARAIKIAQRRFVIDGRLLSIAPKRLEKRFKIIGPRRKVFLEKSVTVEEIQVNAKDRRDLIVDVPQVGVTDDGEEEEGEEHDDDDDGSSPRALKIGNLQPLVLSYPYGFQPEYIPDYLQFLHL